MTRTVCGAPLPPVPQERWYPVIAPKGDVPLIVTLLADTFTGVWVHWDGRVLPCYESSECPLCKRRLPNRWVGYIACYSQIPWGDYLKQPGRAVLALSEGAARQLLPTLTDTGSLRGVGIEIRKKFPHKENSPYVVKVRGRADVDGIATEHDVWPSLNRMFGLNEDFWHRHARGKDKPHPQGVSLGVQLPCDATLRPAGRENQPTKEQIERFRESLNDLGKMP